MTEVINEQKCGESSGVNYVPAEIIKTGGLICSLHMSKKGDQLNCNKYKDITLLCTTYKLSRTYYEQDEKASRNNYRGLGRGEGEIEVRGWYVSGVSADFIICLQVVTAYDRITKRRPYKTLAQQCISREMAGRVRTACQRQWHKRKRHYSPI